MMCAARAEYDLPTGCYRTIDAAAIDKKLTDIHTTLGADMRLLLTDFCKTYAQNPDQCKSLYLPKNNNETKK